MRLYFLTAVMLSSPVVAAVQDGRSVEIINSADTDIIGLDTATAGSRWQPVALHAGSLRKGETASIAFENDTCLRDFRAVFADASALILRDVDVCRESKLDPSFYRARMHLNHAKTNAPQA